MTLMTSHLLLMSAIVVATATLGASRNALSEPLDAQSQAAALLSGLHAHGKSQASDQGDVSPSRASADAHASAAALLTGRAHGQAKTIVRIQPPDIQRTQRDAHAQAAALLSGSRTSGDAKREASPAAGSGK
jgi:hypothetical protein